LGTRSVVGKVRKEQIVLEVIIFNKSSGGLSES